MHGAIFFTLLNYFQYLSKLYTDHLELFLETFIQIENSDQFIEWRLLILIKLANFINDFSEFKLFFLIAFENFSKILM